MAIDDAPRDTKTAAVRQIEVTATPVGRDGWRGQAEVHVDVVVLRRTPAGWRIDSVTPES